MSPSAEPFDAEKYKALLDGLEAVEIKYSDLQTLKTMRIDNEYFSKGYIENEVLLRRFNYKSIGEIVGTITDFGAYSQTNFIELQDQGINFFRNQDVKNNVIDNSGCAKISNEVYNKLTLKLQLNDILMPRTGTLGNACVVGEEHLPASANQNLAVLRNIQAMLPHYVSVVLCSKIGLLQINRNSTGNVQQWLNLDAIKGLKIPNATGKFQKTIQKIVISSKEFLNKATCIYNRAERLLSDRVGFSTTKTTCENNSIKKLSDSFGISGRLDAEFYQEKYERYTESLRTDETVDSLCKFHDNTFLPKENENYRYIELSNVGLAGEISGVDTVSGADLPSRARRKVRTGQIVISSVEGSLQNCALITEEFDGALCSTGFYVLSSETINPETLLVLFKSEPIQALMKQRCSGTILTAISKDELNAMPFPTIDDNVQEEIANKVQQSFAFRRQSKQLLEYAKQAVEMAIEQGEESALVWLTEKIR